MSHILQLLLNWYPLILRHPPFIGNSVPPTFDTSNVQPEVHWFVNQTRSLDCTLTEGIDPPPQIKWERHGVPVVTGPDVQISLDGSKLTVPLVQPRDAGEYVCHAQNEVGKSTQIFNVLVYGKFIITLFHDYHT